MLAAHLNSSRVLQLAVLARDEQLFDLAEVDLLAISMTARLGRV